MAYLGYERTARKYAIRARVAFALDFCRKQGVSKEQTWVFVAEYLTYA